MGDQPKVQADGLRWDGDGLGCCVFVVGYIDDQPGSQQTFQRQAGLSTRPGVDVAEKNWVQMLQCLGHTVSNFITRCLFKMIPEGKKDEYPIRKF